MKKILSVIILVITAIAVWAEQDGAPNYIDEVVWVVGDEAILRSDIEMTRMQAEQEGMKWDGDPDCRIPEQLAVQKLFLNQAALDSIEVTESEIAQGIEQLFVAVLFRYRPHQNQQKQRVCVDFVKP